VPAVPIRCEVRQAK